MQLKLKIKCPDAQNSDINNVHATKTTFMRHFTFITLSVL